MTCCRNINFVTHGFGAPVNYTPAGPMGNQFASPFGDPYRVQAVNAGFWSGIGSAIGGLFSGIGKIAAPVLPGLAQVGVSSLISRPSGAQTQQPSQSQFTQATGQAVAQQQSAAAEKSNTAIYVAVGAAVLVGAYFLLSKRRR